jgi:mannan endo-1,4-beta-mannosidase
MRVRNFKILFSSILIISCHSILKVSAQECVMKVKATSLYTADNQKVIFRGVNAFTIFGRDEDGFPTFKDISATGANVSRIVWKAAMTDGSRMNPNQLEVLIKECISRKMLAMPELHDATGSAAGSKEWNLVMDYWISPDVKAIIKKYEKFILLNIANEVLPNKVTQEWEDLYKTAITRLRQAGYKCPFVIDAPQWGRYVDAIISNGKNLIEHDPDHNVMFSWHPWNTFTLKTDIKKGIDGALEQNLCMIIGEFGVNTYYDKGDPDIPQYIMQYSQEKQTGFISWEWYNKGEQHEHISNNPDEQCDGNGNCTEPTYTPFGRLVLFDAPNSISKTSVKVDESYFNNLTGCNVPTKTDAELNPEEGFKLYPNPSSGEVTVQSISGENYTIEVYDIQGK